MERIAEVSADGDMDERGGGGNETVTAVSLIVFLLLSAGADGGVEDAIIVFCSAAKNYEPKNEGKNIKGQKIRHVPKGQGLSSANSVAG